MRSWRSVGSEVCFFILMNSFHLKSSISVPILYLDSYLLYDLNPAEGFNLRRDVFIRIAVFVKRLQQHGDWVLVSSIYRLLMKTTINIEPYCRCYLPGALSLIGSLKTLEISSNSLGKNFSTLKAL